MSGWHGIAIPFNDRDDWLEKRREGIGASDIAGVVGLSPWASPYTVYASKVLGFDKEQSEAMSWGLKLEDVIVREFQERTGLHVGMRETLVRHPKFPWVRATVDGVAFESPQTIDAQVDDALGLVQVKTDHQYGRWDEVPDHYVIQVTWEMLTTGLDQTWVPVLHGGRNLEIYEVKYDPGLANRILDLATQFYGKHINPLDGEPVAPEVDDHPATTRVIKDLWEDTVDEPVELPAKVAADLEVIKAKKKQKRELEKEIDGLENRVKDALKESTVGTVGGVPAVTWETQERKEYRVAAKSFRVLRIK